MINLSSQLCKEKYSLHFKIQDKNIQFDCPAEIYHSQLVNGTKPILLKVQKSTASKIFISSNNALGIFFLNKKVQIYVTRPVFKQLVMRMKELQSFFVSYDDPIDKTNLHSVFDVNFKKTFSRINFITFNENFDFGNFKLHCIPSGTFLGWCNYILNIQDKKIGIFSSFSSNKRISNISKSEKLYFLIVNCSDLHSHIDEKIPNEQMIINTDSNEFEQAITFNHEEKCNASSKDDDLDKGLCVISKTTDEIDLMNNDSNFTCNNVHVNNSAIDHNHIQTRKEINIVNERQFDYNENHQKNNFFPNETQKNFDLLNEIYNIITHGYEKRDNYKQYESKKNKREKTNQFENAKMQEYQQFLKCCQEESVKVIPIDFSTYFYEIFLFLIASIESNQIKIIICTTIHKKLVNLINESGKWIHTKFRIDLQDIFPKSKKNIIFYDTLSDIDELPSNSIIFCSIEEYEIVTKSLNTIKYWEYTIKKFTKKKFKIQTKTIDSPVSNKSTNSKKKLNIEQYPQKSETSNQLKEILIKNNEVSNKSTIHYENGNNTKAFFYNKLINQLPDHCKYNFIQSSLQKYSTPQKPSIFYKKYVVLNIMNDLRIDYDYKFNFNLILDLNSLQKHFIHKELILINTEQTYDINIYNHNFHTYLVKCNHVLYDSQYLLINFLYENRIIFSIPENLKQYFDDDFYYKDGYFYFPNRRKKIKIHNNEITIDNY